MKASFYFAGMLLAASMVPAMAADEVVFDSLSTASPYPIENAQGNFTGWEYEYQSWSTDVVAIGDKVTLTGTNRFATGFDIGLFQAVGSAASSVDLTLSIYDITGSLLVTQGSGTYSIPSYVGSTSNNGRALELHMNIGPFNLPESFIYTVKLNVTSGSSSGLGFWLYDYYYNAGAIVGTDVGTTGTAAGQDVATTVYGLDSSLALVTLDGTEYYLADGYTPAVRFVTTPVPEPTTYAMLLGGLAGLLAIRRRRKA